MRPTINLALIAWLAGYSTLTWASSTYAQDILAFDWMSLLFAAASGLLGGAARTILTMISPRALVGNVAVLLMKDLIVALFGGAVVYMLIQGYNSWAGSLTVVTLPPIARDLRVLLVVAAGYSRGRWFGVVDRFATDAIANASQKLRGGAADAPPVVATPDAGGAP
ncbi:hypothetical protein GT347_20375 [Xylophilus rhododendri]|uniref:Uncharacterized protein n=1 Tax=Xylophilus rhododendri TaxID=2697032 RepID=A0A857JBK3_9BURK|nr:hypothetical protein [Xylophilus rhododendri]QHJ00129.1 hypothetical protein GT347_20375 [Xylophilus rhododendri]